MILFTYLKIILLQYFQFSVFSFSNNKLNPNGPSTSPKRIIQNPKESTSLTLQPHLIQSNGLSMISILSFASSFCVIFICSRIYSTPSHSLTSKTKVLCRSRVSSTALVKSSKYTKESELKLREGKEVQREAHLLDKTPILIASLMGKKQRMLRRIESGKALIRSSSSKMVACLLHLVQ